MGAPIPFTDVFVEAAKASRNEAEVGLSGPRWIPVSGAIKVVRSFRDSRIAFPFPLAGAPANTTNMLGRSGSTSVSVHTRRSSAHDIVVIADHRRNVDGLRMSAVSSINRSTQSKD